MNTGLDSRLAPYGGLCAEIPISGLDKCIFLCLALRVASHRERWVIMATIIDAARQVGSKAVVWRTCDLSLFPRGHVLQTAGERYATSGEQLHPDCSYRLETVRCYGEVKS